MVNGDIEQKSIWKYLIESGFSEIIQNINCINKNGWLSIVGFFSKNVMISNEKIEKIIDNLRGIFINKFIKIYLYLSEEDNSCYKIGVLVKSDVV